MQQTFKPSLCSSYNRKLLILREKAGTAQKNQPLLLTPTGRAWNRDNISNILRTAIMKMGLDFKHFAPHSLRIGRATDMAASFRQDGNPSGLESSPPGPTPDSSGEESPHRRKLPACVLAQTGRHCRGLRRRQARIRSAY